MVRKRLIGVITVIDTMAVQSFGYNRYLPLGDPGILAENLDRWRADEILVSCIDRSIKNKGPNISLLQKLNKKGLSTPVIYSGGIKNSKQAITCIQSGAERICIDSALHQQTEQIYEISSLIGSQAIIGSFPLHVKNKILYHYNYLSKKSVPFNNKQQLLIDGVISEALVIDTYHEGVRESFDVDIIKLFPDKNVPLIIFGGLSESSQLSKIFRYSNVAAAGIGNFLNYSEHSFQSIKSNINSIDIRPAVYLKKSY